MEPFSTCSTRFVYKSGFSEKRFQTITGWTPAALRGKRVLDAGCGAGRFAEIAIRYGARLIAFDLSSAVDACAETLRDADLWLAQASIFEPPFNHGMFDYVYCIGVIQHTPDPQRAIRSLCDLVRPGGQIGLWIYEKNWKAYVGTTGFKYALRFITKRLPRKSQVRLSEILVRALYPIVKLCRHAGFFGRVVTRLLPVAAAHLHDIDLSDADLRTWIILDTLDMYSPAFDQPQRYSDVVAVLREKGFGNIQRHPHGAISVTATRNA